MKILFDHQIFCRQTFGGISRYFTEMMQCFPKEKEIEFACSAFLTNNEYLQKAQIFKVQSLVKGFPFPGKSFILDFINRPSSTSLIKKKNYDIFHPTFFNPYFVNYLDEKPFVLTIYDMIFEILPDLFARFPDSAFASQKRILATKASKIIAISENTKKDIITYLKIPASQISVVHLATSFSEKREISIPGIDVPDKFILYVGNRGAYKNFLYFVSEIAEIIKKDREMKIVCFGGKKFMKSEIELFDEKGIKEKVIHFSGNDTILKYLYKKATAFVFPSSYEGFGIPVLESFACGCPAVLANTSSLPEVGDDAALYFDPNEEGSLKEALLRLFCDNKIRGSLIEKGFKRVSCFSWEKTAKDTIKVYKEIIE